MVSADASLLTMCDMSLGRVLDAFDKHSLWDDTMLIVNTDHGLLMGARTPCRTLLETPCCLLVRSLPSRVEPSRENQQLLSPRWLGLTR